MEPHWNSTNRGHREGGSSSAHPPQGSMPVFQPPPTAQPPVQIPFSDPFHNRDPFLPGSQHRRKDSYGGGQNGTPLTPLTGGERGWTAQAGPPPYPAHLHHGPPQHSNPPYNGNEYNRAAPPSWDPARRRSVGGAASPPRYAGPLEPPPPPPAFASRNMPPPSPSVNGAPFPSHPSRPPHSASPYNGTPDLGHPSSRPHTGMAISSLIGGERHQHPNRSPKAVTTQNSPTFRPSHPLSPKRARSTSMRSDFGRAPRATSPRGPMYGPPHHLDNRDRQYQSHQEHSMQPVHTPFSAPAFRAHYTSPSSEHFSAAERGPLRPNSQPSSSVQQNASDVFRGINAEPKAIGAFREYHPTPPAPPHHPHEYRDPPSRAADPAFLDKQHYPAEPYYRQTPPNGTPDRWYKASEYSSAPNERWMDRQGADQRVNSGPNSSPSNADRSVFEPRFRHYPGPPSEASGRDTPSFGRRDEDGAPIPRSHLTVSPELNRKGGRSSPLPQAVQGAQPQLLGPGRDPSIKNEFGRMFSGLGSGVGGSGTPVGPFSAAGNLTPSRLSPSRFVDREGSPGEHENVVGGTSLLHQGEHQRLGNVVDMDDADGRSTPSQTNGNKRVKTDHAGHRHHHHAHAHHHHHHHHGAVDESVANQGGFNTLRFPSAGGTPDAVAKVPHHHHHHHGNHGHTGHHHHRQTKAAEIELKPQVIVRNDLGLIVEASDKPRLHLGNALYSTNLTLPASKSSNLNDTRFFFASSPTSMPQYEDRVNCTFTVRVPREYLSGVASTNPDTGVLAGGLEEICRRRAIWGTEMYTDDSDVVAAAVHSGWIKGNFGETLDKDLQDLFPAKYKAYDPGYAIYSMPDLPVVVPEGLDMHVTVVLLPPLTAYTGTTQYHLKSRSWGDNHDGMSYMINKIEFVDEPRASRHDERGGKAKKARVKAELERRREAADSLLGLGRARVAGSGGGGSVSVGA